MDIDVFKNLILETENLTDNMEDNEAKRLLDWGIAQLPMMLEGDADSSFSGLMRTMRTINRIIGDLPTVSVDNLKTLTSHYAQTFNTPFAINDEEYQSTSASLSALSADEALTYLLNWLNI